MAFLKDIWSVKVGLLSRWPSPCQTRKTCLELESDRIISTGGMSVDPDDLLRFAIRDAGIGTVTGAPFLPALLANA